MNMEWRLKGDMPPALCTRYLSPQPSVLHLLLPRLLRIGSEVSLGVTHPSKVGPR